jgi:hypothetical protein
MGAYLSLRRGAMHRGCKSHISWLAAWPPALCVGGIRRAEFGFHSEPSPAYESPSSNGETTIASFVLSMIAINSWRSGSGTLNLSKA